jgi:hypothetical protein
MSRKLICVFILLVLLPAIAFAQSGKLRGLVTDKATGEPLVGANVLVVGTQYGASTDMNGTYVVLAVPPGVYAIRATYIGYQTEDMQNIRVSSNQTTTQDFALTTTAIRGEAVVIVADRPLIQRNTTNTVRMTTSEDIQNLPIRGFQSIIALNAGTVVQNGALYIRGGRSGEVGYYIDGASATNPINSGQVVSVIQEAIEEIQMQTGGFTAEYGGANSAVVNTTVRTGGQKFRATLDYRTDAFADPSTGGKFLGTTPRGYHNAVATISGPLTSRLRFFIAGQYNYQKNRSNYFIEPFKFDPVDASLPEWSIGAWQAGQRNFYAPWLVEDGLSGRTGANQLGLPLTDVNGNVMPFQFYENYLPNNSYHGYDVNSTFVFTASKALKLRLTGSYSHDMYPNSGFSRFYDAVNHYYDSGAQYDRTKYDDALVSLRATHILNPTTFYDVSVSYTYRAGKGYDERWGDEWWKYTDSRVWDEEGYDASEWQNLFVGPMSYSTILDFTLTPINEPRNGYNKYRQMGLGGALDFTTQVTKNIELKAGGRFDRWSYSTWSIGNISNYMNYRYGIDGSLWPADGFDLNSGGKEWNDVLDPVTGEVLYTAEYLRRIDLTKAGGLTHYGWDYDGETKTNEKGYEPRTPLFANAYLQTKWEYRDLILNLGLRWEHFDYHTPRPKDVEMVPGEGYDATNEWIDVNELTYTEPYDYLLPRINFAFPVTDRTVFYAQYGKYAQPLRLDQIFNSVYGLQAVLPEYRSVYGAQVLFLAKPQRTNQYELGIRQTLTNEFAFTITAFYRDMLDQLRRDRIYADGLVPGGMPAGGRFIGGLLNNDVGTSKGVELTLELRRTKRLAARMNYTLSDTRGTGSSYASNNVVMSDVLNARYPSLIYPLDQNQPHVGTVMADYRFAKGDGGKILEGVGLNVLMQFTSGHSYTQVMEPYNLGQANPWNVGTRMTYDTRFRNPVEPVNSSLSPWNFTIDLNLEKTLFFNRFNFRLYANVLNLLNTKNIINVYQTTGTDNDDGWLKCPLAAQYVIIPGYEPMYRAINLQNGWGWTYATGGQLWSAPRQIRLGLMIEFN